MNWRNLYFLVFLIGHCLVASAQQCYPTFQEILVIDGECAGNAVIYTPTDEVVVAGKLAHDAFILKTSPNGQIVWGHRLQHADTSTLNNIKLSADGNYIALGTIAHRLWITKIDPSGNPIWNRLLSIGADPVNAKEIIELSSGGYAIIA